MRGPLQRFIFDYEKEIREETDFVKVRKVKRIGRAISGIFLAATAALSYQVVNNGDIVEWILNRAFDAVEVGATGLAGVAAVEGLHVSQLARRREDELLAEFVDGKR
jgi:hypothetical protein